MKVTCHLCRKDTDDGQCVRVVLNGEELYAHDECTALAFDAYTPDEEDDGVKPELTPSAFLRDLGEKLRHVPPAVAGTDQYHAERCVAIADQLDQMHDALVQLQNALEEVVVSLKPTAEGEN